MTETIPEKLRAYARDRDRYIADATLFRAADVIEKQTREIEQLRAEVRALSGSDALATVAAEAERDRLKAALAAWLPAAKARQAMFGENLHQDEQDLIRAAEAIIDRAAAETEKADA